ncbi:peptidoglycan-binding protein [Brachybacterium epidermidis]|uniref:peptidoglycan-binding protein n=1 Tax=Brachybacterium epidermidis TaxID=2781983 RepID=UPI00398F246D
MIRTVPRGTHRAPGAAVIDYRGLAAPVGRGVGGAALLGAVTATAALQGVESARAQAPAPATLGSINGAAAAAPVTLPTVAPAAPDQFAGVKLRPGSRGAAVEHLQALLNQRGASIAVDGVFGRNTTGAVRALQSAAGIGVDAVVGPKTWSALAGNIQISSSAPAPATSAPSPAASSQPKLRQGNRGDAVRTLQSQLNERGASIAVDGVFGSGTAAAVRALQSAADIGVDAVVGPKTWNALYSNVRISDAPPSRDSGRAPVASVGSFNGQAIVDAARAQKGVRYTWGGSSPASGFDCSGLVHHAYNQAGINLPRKTAKGYTFGGRIISQAEAQPGDLVAFTSNNYGHIGIYVGNGRIIDASGSRQRVVERNIWNAPHVFVTYR